MIREFATRDAAMNAAEQRMAEALNAGITARGHAIAALSGGSTPGPAYERLAAAALDWSKITFALVDERFVPPSDPASNEGLIRRTLASAFAAGARLLPLYADVPTVSVAADLADPLYQPLTFDIALMGMGEDGHTASWFPGGDAAALDPSTTRSVMAVTASAARGAAERLTVTYPLIRRARSVLLLLTGDAKRAALERGSRLSLDQAPVGALFLNRAPEIFWAA